MIRPQTPTRHRVVDAVSRVVLLEGGFALRLSPHEPPCVTAVSRQGTAKVWLRPIALEYAAGLSAADVRGVLRLVADHQLELLKAWASLREAAGADPRSGRHGS